MTSGPQSGGPWTWVVLNIETCVRELKDLARPELIATEVREERFVVHRLQIAIQTAQEVASHIVSDDRLGESENNRQLFELLIRT